MASYFSSFQLATRDASGYVDEFGGEDLDIYTVSGDTYITTITSDTDTGSVEAASISPAEGTAIYFKHASYSTKFYQTTADTEDNALLINVKTLFLVEDLFTQTEYPARVDVWLDYESLPEVPPVKIGTVRPGDTLKYTLETLFAKDARLRMFPEGSDFSQIVTLPEDAPETTVSLTSIESELSGSQITILDTDTGDHATTGTTAETLWTYSLPGASLNADGDAVEIVAGGSFAANANQKIAYFNLFGTDTSFLVDSNGSGGGWQMSIQIIRVSSSVVRVAGLGLPDGGADYAEITGLTLSNANDLKVQGRSPDNTGDITLRMVRAVLIPA
ncbi:MAG: hypothetical protein R2747_04940 [Pyrinomonadaceae bacterium]